MIETAEDRFTIHGELLHLKSLRARQQRAAGLYLVVSEFPEVTPLGHPMEALYCEGAEACGELAWLDPQAFRWACDRVELMTVRSRGPGAWSRRAASRAAHMLAPMLADRLVLLLGSRLVKAFEAPKDCAYRWRSHALGGHRFLVAASMKPEQLLERVRSGEAGATAVDFWKGIGAHFEKATNLAPGGRCGIA